MKTISQVVEDIYVQLVQASSGLISGGVYRYKRPKNSELEDIVIQCSGNRTTKFQQYNYLFVRIYVPDLLIGGNQLPNSSRFPLLEEFLFNFSNTLHATDRYAVDLSTRQIETLAGDAFSSQEETPFYMIVLTLQIKNLIHSNNENIY